MRVLVTGATGFVGREVLRQLQGTGKALTFLARNPASESICRYASASRAEVRAGDLTQPGALKTALEGIDAVIHLVGIISEVGAQTFERVHQQGAANLIAAAQHAGVKRFIHMSALGTRPNAVSRYHQTKWAAEEAVRQSGLACTIFRPSLIFGPNDQFVNLFARMSRFSPVLPILGRPDARFQPVSVQEVAAAFVSAIDEPRAIGQTFDLCGGETVTFTEILQGILAATHRQRILLRIPRPLAQAQAAALEFLFPRLLKQAPPLNRDQLLMLQEDNTGNGLPARQLFGLPGLGFREGIKAWL
jgi:NADH dehydrogenase